jgi:hypothetical protein
MKKRACGVMGRNQDPSAPQNAKNEKRSSLEFRLNDHGIDFQDY